MANILAERKTVESAQPVVVFLIGMRVNQWWKVHKWLPVMLAMPRMLRELKNKPESGMLGVQASLGFIVQYWESSEKLIAYARDRSGQHYPAWAAFNRKIGTDGSVGVWHETYVVAAGSYECVYVNMPPIGLGAFKPLLSATGKRSRASGRLGVAEQPEQAPA